MCWVKAPFLTTLSTHVADAGGWVVEARGCDVEMGLVIAGWVVRWAVIGALDDNGLVSIEATNVRVC